MSRPTSGSPSAVISGCRPSTSLDQTYLATGAATNVAVTVSTGDNSLAAFPASSPNVIGVGGTALHATGTNNYGYETAWGGLATNGAGGGGTTAFFTNPSFQTSNGVTNYNGHRNLPDVSLIADPVTGVSVYDSYDTSSNGGNPWTQIGGTSLASPVFAGELAIVQQHRVAASKPILNSVQINNALYGLYNSPSYSTYFHDITQGTNSEPAYSFAGHQPRPATTWRPGWAARSRTSSSPISPASDPKPRKSRSDSRSRISDLKGFPATIGNLKSGI